MGTNTDTENGVTKTRTVNGPGAGPVRMVPVPANSAAPGGFGQIAEDGTYLYVWSVAGNSWRRITLDSF